MYKASFIYLTFQASELTTCQATLEKDRRDSRSALETESGSLRAQLQSHADSIKILVAEKADFEASLRKINMELANKNGMSRFISDVIQIWLVFIFWHPPSSATKMV